MKKYFLLTIFALMICAVFGSPKVAAQSKISKEEYEIYSIVFNKMFEGDIVTFDTRTKIKQLVIKNYTVVDYDPLKLDGRYLKQIKEMLPMLLTETAVNYAEASKTDYQIKNNLDLEIKSVLIEKSAVEQIFKQGTGNGEGEEWKEFYKQFPDSGGIVGISRVGFNPAKNQALVYFEHWCRPTCGTGHYVVLNKENGKWKFLQEFSPWIS